MSLLPWNTSQQWTTPSPYCSPTRCVSNIFHIILPMCSFPALWHKIYCVLDLHYAYLVTITLQPLHLPTSIHTSISNSHAEAVSNRIETLGIPARIIRNSIWREAMLRHEHCIIISSFQWPQSWWISLTSALKKRRQKAVLTRGGHCNTIATGGAMGSTTEEWRSIVRQSSCYNWGPL